jgi:exosortase A-associated hydrolase 1
MSTACSAAAPDVYAETVLNFQCQGENLLGIVSAPEINQATNQTANQTGVIIIVGGPQYRVGSHRQFVLLARSLASAGYTSLRFDYRGMGDSSGTARDFLQITPDIQAAIDALLLERPELKQIVLWGLCDGASAALLYLQASPENKIAGLCLLNPWVRSAASLARTQVKHYYGQRLKQREFWLKLLSGRIAVGAVSELIRSARAALSGPKPIMATSASALLYQTTMVSAWAKFAGPILLMLSGNDYVAKEFLEYANTDDAWRNALKKQDLVHISEPDADHTFSDRKYEISIKNSLLNLLNRVQKIRDTPA